MGFFKPKNNIDHNAFKASWMIKNIKAFLTASFSKSSTLKLVSGCTTSLSSCILRVLFSEATKLNASAEAEKISKTGLAEAEKIMAIGKSTAEAYELQVSAMGGDNFTKYKITEEIGKGNIKVIPDVLITGSNGSEGGISGLLGMKLMEMMDTKNGSKDEPKKK